MEFISTQKYVITSPRKLRLVAGMVKHMSPAKAVEVLPYVGKRAALPLAKTIQSAIANAKVQSISETDLVIKEIQINEGPRLKRGMPVSRGRWHPIIKRMSHIRVVLEKKKDVKKEVSSKSNNVDTNKEVKTQTVAKAVKPAVSKKRKESSGTKN